MQANSDVLEAMRRYLGDNGATIGDTFIDPAPDNAFVRYEFEGRGHMIGITSVAEHALRHWRDDEIDAFLHSYRVLPGASDLRDGEFLLVRSETADPRATFLSRGFVVVAASMDDFGVQ